MMFLNMYENTDNGEDEEYVESLPESYSEEDLKAMEEAKKQKEEQLHTDYIRLNEEKEVLQEQNQKLQGLIGKYLRKVSR